MLADDNHLALPRAPNSVVVARFQMLACSVGHNVGPSSSPVQRMTLMLRDTRAESLLVMFRIPCNICSDTCAVNRLLLHRLSCLLLPVDNNVRRWRRLELEDCGEVKGGFRVAPAKLLGLRTDHVR